MEIHDLKLFCRTAEMRSISKAAASLRMAQASLSNRIQKLEQELGLPLFRRTHKGVELTANGVKFEAYARRCIGLLDEAVETLKATSERPRIRIGATASIAECILAPILKSLVQQGSEVCTYTNHSQQILEMVLDGLLEAGFCLGAPSIPGIRFIHLRDIPIYCVCSSNHELAKLPSGSYTLRDVVCHPTAIYSWGEGEDDLRRRIAEASGTLDTPAYAKVSPATVAKKLVKEGVISFLPFDLIQEDVDQGQMTILHPQDYPDYKWRLGVAVRDRKVDGHELDALWHTLGT